ncbi:hypothetical protein RSAG8_04426, partial [Rhizoctonia solani AG-8 WAC10335]
MKAIVIDHYAHPSKQPVSNQASEPKPAADEVLVEVHTAALNFFDILQAQGKYQNQPPFPFVLGAEFAGTISASSPIPKGCPFKPGDRVFGSAQGTYAERIAAKWHSLHPIPNGFSFEQAAGLFVTWPTSYEALVGRAQLQPGEWCLDVIYDPVGLIKDSLKCIAWKGRALVVGFAAGEIEKLPLNLVLLKNISIVGIHWGAYMKNDVAHVPSVWKALFELFESGRVKPVVFSEVYQGLEQVSAGLEALEQRKTWGKAIVQIKPGPKIAKL